MTILSATIGPIIQTHTGVLLKNDTDQMIVIPLFDENGDQYTGSVTNLGVNFILNGGTDVTLSTTCVYSATAGGHKLTIPSANITALGKYSACVTGDEIGTVLLDGLVIPDFISLAAINAEVDTAISDAGLVTKIDTVDTVVDGIATTLATPANFMADVSALATSAEITALNDLSAQQVWEYTTRTLTAIPTGTATATALSAAQGDITSIKSTVEGISVVGGTGAEKVIPRTYYELSAVANTITLSSPYDTITEEQIISICDLTTGDVIYSCEIPIKHTISVSSGVITFTYDNNSIAAEDILQIIVNQV